MPKLTPEEIRTRFESSDNFNAIFEAFEEALSQKIQDIELYRLLFWNQSLTADEICLFGEKLSTEFPSMAYDTFMWLANIFEVTYSSIDNYERALKYYRKAAQARPDAIEPYLRAANCYEPDLNIPAIETLIRFLKEGTQHVSKPVELYKRLADLFEISGNDEMREYYRRKADKEMEESEED